MEFDTIETLRERHPAWRLLRAGNAGLILSFLGDFFVEGNRGACSGKRGRCGARRPPVRPQRRRHRRGRRGAVPEGAPGLPGGLGRDRRGLAAPLLPARRRRGPLRGRRRRSRRRYAWVAVAAQRGRSSAPSRGCTPLVELLRQIVSRHRRPTPSVRLAELRRRRDEIDAEIAAVEAGDVTCSTRPACATATSSSPTTARELLSDFREVEENFRRLDRAARERIATWDGAKGDLLADLVGSRSEITDSDQGRSFQAFYDFLLSESRQARAGRPAGPGRRARPRSTPTGACDGIHHDWSEAAERAQRTVRQISEQLRRFLDDQVWLENRRVLDLVREVETAALDVATVRTDVRPRRSTSRASRSRCRSSVRCTGHRQRPSREPDPSDDRGGRSRPAVHPDLRRPGPLADNIRAVLPEHSAALLSDIVAMYPLEQGAAEIVGYLAARRR